METDSNGKGKSLRETAEIVKDICENITGPLIIYESGNSEKDVIVLEKVAKACQRKISLLEFLREITIAR